MLREFLHCLSIIRSDRQSLGQESKKIQPLFSHRAALPSFWEQMYLIKGISSFSRKNRWIKSTLIYLVLMFKILEEKLSMSNLCWFFLGPTDLSMKRQLATSSGSSSSSSSRPQLSPTEINAVRQLVAGYRESAAFLLRSADELENLILQQNWVQRRSSSLRFKFAVSTNDVLISQQRCVWSYCTVLREIFPLCHIVLDP